MSVFCGTLKKISSYPTSRVIFTLAGTRRYIHNEGPGASPPEQPAPLMDLHGRRHDYLRISLTERCNLRCQYCMPAAGVPLSARASLLTREELLRLARLFAALGVHKMRLTGGEPTLRADLVDLVQELSAVAGVRTVAMTTNGVALARRLPALRRAGLRALNVSLDTLRADRFERLARRPGLARVLASIDVALQLDFRPVKVNTVLMKGFNDDEIYDFVEFTKDREVEVRFIEFMPFAGNEWRDVKMVPEREVVAALRARFPALRPLPAAGGARGTTGSAWAVAGHAGSVGFVSSMSAPFCGGCSRLRLTADGSLKVCLFGAAETSLRDALRAGASDDDVAALVRAALRRKLPRHAESRPPEEPADDSDRWLSGCRPRALDVETFTAGTARARARGVWPWGTRASGPRAWGERASGARAAGARGYCTLSHVDGEGRARMVDVGAKPKTARSAEAECRVRASTALLQLLRAGAAAKGDALAVAELAGVMGAKRTADLIPLCHALPLELVRVRVALPEPDACDAAGGYIRVTCEARAHGRTGVEMEALTGCAVAALALYDMCKAADKRMVVEGLRVLRKAGGRSDWPQEGPQGPAPPA